MDTVNLYGDIRSDSSVIIGAGNFNNISGVLVDDADRLQIRSMAEVLAPTVVEFILHYEQPITAQPNKLYFSLRVKPTRPLFQTLEKLPTSNSVRYLNAKIEAEGDRQIAVTCLSSDKAIFSVDYSAIDRTNRDHLLAGSLYSLEYTFGEQTYVISWKMHDSINGDLIIFLPTTWYERQLEICSQQSGVNLLVERLNQVQFKGFTTQKWCETMPGVTHCQDNSLCGDCLGQCADPSQICYPNLDTGNFICGSKQVAPDMTENNLVSFSDVDPPPTTTGTGATWVAVVIIFLIVLLLAWGLNTRLKIE